MAVSSASLPSARERPEAWANQDFGRMVTGDCANIVRPRNADDVVETVRAARRDGTPIAARGRGHSTRGQSLVRGGTILDMTRLNAIRLEGHTAVVEAGAAWDGVVEATLAAGLVPPVLTDYLGLSVGGTLSMGGLGTSSFRRGLQTDHLSELLVCTGRGELIRCSRVAHRDLFDAVRAGLGQCAILVEARITLIHAPSRVRIATVRCDGLDPFLARQLSLSADVRVDGIHGSAIAKGSGWRFSIEVLRHLTEGDERGAIGDAWLAEHGVLPDELDVRETTFSEYVFRLRSMEQTMRANGSWGASHPWIDVWIPARHALPFISDTLADLDPHWLVDGHVMTYPMLRSACTTPLVELAEDRHVFLFDVLANAMTPDRLADLESRSRRLFRRARSIGGRMYPIGAPVGTPEIRAADWLWQHHRTRLAFVRAKVSHDPAGILTPQFGVFFHPRPLPKTPSRRDYRVSGGVQTLGDLAEAKLRLVGHALGRADESARAIAAFRLTSDGWAHRLLRDGPGWKSNICDDASPFELSVSFGEEGTEMRFLTEPQRLPIGRDSSWREALQVVRRLRDHEGANIRGLEAIADLFAPTSNPATSQFSLWLAVVPRLDGVWFKAYVNPQARGVDAAPALVEEALVRLGLGSAWGWLTASLGASLGDRLLYLGIDLIPGASSRVKLYVAHPGASAAQIEAACRDCRNYHPGDVPGWLEALVGERPLDERPVLTCFAFTVSEPRPEFTLHVPVRSYVEDDEDALARARRVMTTGDGDRLEAVVRAIADRPLEAGRGLITYISLRPSTDRLQVTAYLSPEVFGVAAPRPAPPAIDAPGGECTMAAIRSVVEAHRALFMRHPFWRWLENEEGPAAIHAFAPRLTFFVMTFQDILRIACAMVTDPHIHSVVASHEAEDKGHDRWFLADLERLGIPPAESRLFLPENEAIRDLSYGLLAEILSARDDRERLAVILSLEAAGRVFFRSISAYLERHGLADDMRYFGRHHLAVELAHDMFDTEIASLAAISVSHEQAGAVSVAVARTFAAMWRLGWQTLDRAASDGQELARAQEEES